MGSLGDFIADGVRNTYGKVADKVTEKKLGQVSEKIVEKVVETPFRVADGAIKAVDTVLHKVDDSQIKTEENEERKLRAYLKKKRDQNPSFNHLTLLFDLVSYGFMATRNKASYILIDSDCNQIYYAKGQDNKHKQHITVFSRYDQKIGEIIEKPKFMDMGTSNYIIKTVSGKMVSMKTKLLTIGTKYKITPLNWSFQSSGLAKYEVLDENDNVIMKYSNKPFSLGRGLHIEYKEKKDEDMAVLIALSIYANYLMTERHPYREDGGYVE